ncbi:MAG: DUF4870 domain-containing protein [Anaerolineae bacterium]|nr:DUF4870 domain-containing protein [Anaerolineae bacterium]MCI0608308.1 DUF4870 domain-containing protein [Anaerolineae bacterium]
MNNTPTTEDRIWAVLSHLSAITFGMGILLPIIGWAEQRRKSNYASFQCLQALGYQSLGYTVWFLGYLVFILAFFISILVLSGVTGDSGDRFGTSMGIWISVFIALVFGAFVLYFLLPIIAAIACALGRDFRYPVMGNRLARYLEYDPTKEEWLNEDHEPRWVAAMGHFSVIIALWGMLAPLTTWLTHGKQNLFLKFQSIQTLVFQALITIFYFVAGFVYLFGIFLLFATTGLTGAPDFDSSAGMFGIVIFFVSLLIAFVIILAIPLMHILGQWAGYRVLKGDDYRYPLIGRLVEGWIANKNSLQPPSFAKHPVDGGGDAA